MHAADGRLASTRSADLRRVNALPLPRLALSTHAAAPLPRSCPAASPGTTRSIRSRRWARRGRGGLERKSRKEDGHLPEFPSRSTVEGWLYRRASAAATAKVGVAAVAARRAPRMCPSTPLAVTVPRRSPARGSVGRCHRRHIRHKPLPQSVGQGGEARAGQRVRIPGGTGVSRARTCPSPGSHPPCPGDARVHPQLLAK